MTVFLFYVQLILFVCRKPFKEHGTHFLNEKGIDSLRAVEKCKQHPGKMWVIRNDRMLPLLPLSPAEQPWHSSQYQSLPEVLYKMQV